MKNKKVISKNARQVLARLHALYPQVRCSLDFSHPFELLVATILSAQCTDVRVNLVTPELFRRWPNPQALASAPLEEVEEVIRSTGFFHSKARHLIGCAQALLDRHDGRVPSDLAALTALPGVGRKTANVVLGNVFGIPAMVVDTHVSRLSRRLGWSDGKDPAAIEADLCRLLPRKEWVDTSHLLIAHGRALCKAPIPDCSRCPLFDLCPRLGVVRSR